MAVLEDLSVGKVGFVERHGLWDDHPLSSPPTT